MQMNLNLRFFHHLITKCFNEHRYESKQSKIETNHRTEKFEDMNAPNEGFCKYLDHSETDF